MAIIFGRDIASPSLKKILRVRWVIDQKRNRIHVAERSADMVLTIIATCEGSLANCEKIFAVSMKNGAPGGWPTSSFAPVEINSGQSQNEAVGSIVEQYTKAAMKNVSQPSTLSTRRNCFMLILLLVFYLLFSDFLHVYAHNTQQNYVLSGEYQNITQLFTIYLHKKH